MSNEQLKKLVFQILEKKLEETQPTSPQDLREVTGDTSDILYQFQLHDKRPARPRPNTDRRPPRSWKPGYEIHMASRTFECWSHTEGHQISKGDKYLEAGTTSQAGKVTHRRFCRRCFEP